MKKYIVLGVLLALQIFFLSYIQYTAWPEMLSYPYLVNNGFKLYTDMVHPYPPALTLILSLIYKPFKFTEYIFVLKSFTWTLIILNDLAIFKIVKKVTNKYIYSLIAVLLYVLTQSFLEGNMLWFDIALVTPVLWGTYFLIREKDIKDFILSGLLFALAVFTKQTAGLLLLVSLFYIWYKQRNIKSLIYFLTPSVLLGTTFLTWSLATGQFMEFLNWNLIYPFTFWSKFPGYVQMYLSKTQTFIIALFTLPIIVMGISKLRRINDSKYFLLGFLLIASFVMVYPRFSFFHFQLALSLALILIVSLFNLFKLSKVKSALLVLGYIVTIFYIVIKPSLSLGTSNTTRFWEDSLEFGKYVDGDVSTKDIYFLGLPSSFYVTGQKLPPKPWVDNYGWYFEVPGMQDKVLFRWQENPPYYIYRQAPEAGKWYDIGTYQPQKISNWITSNYELVDTIKDNIEVWQKRN